MNTVLLLEFFQLSLERFKNPFVVSGLLIMFFGIILLCAKDWLSRLILSKTCSKRNFKLIIAIIAGLLVTAGAIMAIITL